MVEYAKKNNYHSVNNEPVVNEAIATRINKYPEASYRTAAWMLQLNKNTVQRIFQLKGWQVRKKLPGFQPRVKSFPNPISVGQLMALRS